MRIGGKDLPKEKNVVIGLTYIYGVGRSMAENIVSQLKIDPFKKIKDLTEEEEDSVRKLIEKEQKIEADLKLEIDRNIRRLKDIRCYRGLRHLKGLPERGQQTRTNARTLKGKRMTVGSGHRKPSAPK